MCDLEQHRVIDPLPDRGGGYGQAASVAAPQAVQVANRRHFMENATVLDPSLLTCAERIQYGGFLLRQDGNQTTKAFRVGNVDQEDLAPEGP